MAHFAELSSLNIVLRVVVIDNNDVIANGGDQSATAAKAEIGRASCRERV